MKLDPLTAKVDAVILINEGCVGAYSTDYLVLETIVHLTFKEVYADDTENEHE